MLLPPKSSPPADANPAIAMDGHFSDPDKLDSWKGTELIRRGTTLLVLWFIAFYALAATVWILFSDQLPAALHPGTAQLSEWQTLKGVFFVVVTTGLLAVFVTNIFEIKIKKGGGDQSTRP